MGAGAVDSNWIAKTYRHGSRGAGAHHAGSKAGAHDDGCQGGGKQERQGGLVAMALGSPLLILGGALELGALLLGGFCHPSCILPARERALRFERSRHGENSWPFERPKKRFEKSMAVCICVKRLPDPIKGKYELEIRESQRCLFVEVSNCLCKSAINRKPGDLHA